MRHSLLVIAIAGLLLPCAASAQRVGAVNPDRSEIRFVGKQMGVPVEGRFRKFTAQLEFDPAKLAASRALIEVDLNSIDTGTAEADEEVKTKAWFNIALFPTAKFQSASMRSLGGNRYEAAGKLSIKGRTRDLAAQFTVRQEGAITWFEGSFPIKRLDFGVGEGPWADTETVADEVAVKFKFAGVPAKKP